VRTNLVINPNMETNITNWTASGGTALATITRDTTIFHSGAASLKAVCSGASLFQGVTSAASVMAALVVGETYTVSAWVYSTVAGLVRVGLTSTSTTVLQTAVLANTWTRVSYTGVANSAALPVVVIDTGNPARATTLYFDDVLVEQSATVGTYFDGSTVDTATATYAWTGTPNASTSTETLADLLPNDHIRVEVAFSTTPDDPAPAWEDISAFVDMTGGVSITTGRADEYAVVQTGSCRVFLDNTDGRFTPGLVPVVTRTNLCPNPNFETDAAGWVAFSAVAAPTRVTTTPFSGVGRLSAVGSAATAAPGVYTTVSAVAGDTITYTARVRSDGQTPTSGFARIQAMPSVTMLASVVTAWAPDANGWQLITATVTVPSGATTSLRIIPGVQCAAVYTGTLGVDEVLIEKSPAAGTYFDGSTAAGVDSNGWVLAHAWTGTADGSTSTESRQPPYYPNVKIRKKLRVTYFDPALPAVPHYRFTGYVEEWPTDWPTGGDTYSTAQVTASDRFKRLGQAAKLKSIIEQEYLADAPAAYFTLGEPTGATTAGDTSKNGLGFLSTVQLGTGGTLTFGANTGPGTDGMPAPAFTPVDAANGKYLSGPATTGFISSSTVETFFLTSAAVIQSVVRLDNGNNSWLQLFILSTGQAYVNVWNGVNAGITPITSAASFNDGNTHHLAVTQSLSAGTVTVTLVVDGVSVGTNTYAAPFLTSFSALWVGGSGFSSAMFNGTIAHVAIYTSALSVARLAVHAAAGLTGFSGERSDQRIARLAGYAGVLTAEQSLEVGSSTSIASVDITGAAPLQSMQDVTATEGGVLFIDGQGLLTFQSRGHRYNATSAATITAPDTDPSLRFISNDALLVNDVTVGRPGGATVRAVDAASIIDYGKASPPGGPITLLTTSDNEVADAANWKANANSDVTPRLPNLTVDLLTSPGLYATVLLLELGSRITLSGLPAQAPASSVDLFIEGWTETITSGGWVIAFNTSPAANSAVWQLDSALYSQLDVSTRLAY
jgi:hypothetical protein